LSSYTQSSCLYIGRTEKNIRLSAKKVKNCVFYVVDGKEKRASSIVRKRYVD